MPFSPRTVNYTQNVPESLAFGSAYFNPSPSREVTCVFQIDRTNSPAPIIGIPGGPNMGTVNIPEISGLTVRRGRFGVNSVWDGSIVISGDVAAVNSALDQAEWLSHFYTPEETGSPGNYRGEVCVHLPSAVPLTELYEGNTLKFSTVPTNLLSTPGSNYTFTVTKVDSTSPNVRVWLIFNRDFQLSEEMLSDVHKGVSVATVSTPCYLQTSAGVNIAPVLYFNIQNAQGNFPMAFREIDATNAVDAYSTINLVGAPFVAEASFTSDPPSSVSATSKGSWIIFNSTNFGQIAQTDGNYQTVSLQIKACTNDPKYLGVTSYTSVPGYPAGGTESEKLLFIGGKINEKAALGVAEYITDNSYGIFGDSQVGLRASQPGADGSPIRWSFYGTPTECNYTLGRINYFRPIDNGKDFAVDVVLSNARMTITNELGPE